MIQDSTRFGSTVGDAFATTRWSIVMATARPDDPSSRQAWEQLANSYWPPIYAYIRRSGHSPEDARDLTQSFFVSLLARGALGGLAPGKGRFRSFLLVCLNHFLTDHHRYAQAACRRPEAGWLSLDESDAEGHYQAQIVDQASPEVLYERQWAKALLDRVLVRLEAHYFENGKRQLFEHLVAHLVRDPEAVPHAALAAQLATSESAIKSEMHRLRERLRLLFREEIATTTPADEIEDEMRHLLRILRG